METISLTSRSCSLSNLSIELPKDRTTSSTHTALYSDDLISANKSVSDLPSVTSPAVGVTSSGDGPQEGAAYARWSRPGRGGDDGGAACSEVNIVGRMGSRRPGAAIDSRLEREWLDASMEPQTVERHGHPSTVDSTANRVQRWPVKTYGTAANQVQVFISRQPAAPERSALSSDGAPRRSKGRSVQLSPVVSEVKWRESYFEEDPGGGVAEPPRKPVPGVREVRQQPPAPAQRRDKTVQKVQVAYPVAGQWEGVVRHVVTSERRSVSPQPPPKPLVATDVSTRVASPDHSTMSSENDQVRNNNMLIITPAKEHAEKVKQKSLLKRLGFGKVTNGKSKSKSPTTADSPASPSLVSISPQFHSEAVTSTPLMVPRTNPSDNPRVDGDASFQYKHPPAAPSVKAPSTPEFRYGSHNRIPEVRHGSRHRIPEARHGSRDRTPEARRGSRDRTPEARHGYRDRTPEGRHGSRERTPEVRHGSRDRTMRSSQSPDRSVLQTSTSSGDRTIAGSPTAQKPPLPPQAIPKLQSQASKMRLHNARRSFLNTNQAPAKTAALETPPSQPPGTSEVVDIKEAFEKFRQRARQERERLAKSSPDLSVIEKTTRGSVQRLKMPQSQDQQQPAAVLRSPQPRRDVEQAFRAARSRAPATRRTASRDRPLHQETSLDGGGGSVQPAVVAVSAADRAKSMVHLPSNDVGDDPRTMKSLEFLLDDQNKAATLPPENQLSRTGCRLSEHQLRFQRSLRNLHVPDWYRRSYRAEASLKRHYSLGSSQVGGWSGFNSKSTSKESLHSNWSAHSGGVQQQQQQKLVIPTRVPLPPRRHTNSGSSGWSGGSTASTSPPCSPPGDWQRGSRPGSSRFQQPYLGWRSKERLNGGYPTPAERLASSVSPDASAAPRRPPQPELQDSIREVTNAIVHYFDGSPSTGSGGVWRETAFLDRARPANPTSPQHPTPSRRLQTPQYQIEDAVFV